MTTRRSTTAARLAALVVFGATGAFSAAEQRTPVAGDIEPSASAPSIYRRVTGIDDTGSYRHEVQSCRSGHTQQARETCLEEARNAHAARQRGQLAGQGENFMANALARCQPLRGEDRVACEARVMGFGSTSGSVAGGGLLREVETVVVPPGSDPLLIRPRTPDPVLIVLTPSR